jgi:hypothetical protein
MDRPSLTAWLSGPLFLRWHGRREEIARTGEVICDFLVDDSAYGSVAASLKPAWRSPDAIRSPASTWNAVRNASPTCATTRIRQHVRGLLAAS